MTKEKDTIKARVETALEKIRPALQADNRCLLWLPDESDDFKDGYRQDFKKGSS